MNKSILITIIGVFIAGLTFAQEEETRNLSSFSKVTVHEAIDVYLTKGSKHEARIVSNSEDLEDVLTDVSGGKLKIHLDGSSHRNVDVKVYVTYVELEAIGASSAATIKANDIVASGDFDVDVSSAGDIIADITADELTVDASSAGEAKLDVKVSFIEAEVSSAGDIQIKGTAIKQDISASSSGDYYAYDLMSEEVEVNVSSGGSAKVQVNQDLKARASSGGSVKYKGSPKYVDSSASSGGSIKKS